jgi:hypothetical protein
MVMLVATREMLNYSRFILENKDVFYRGIVGEYDKNIAKQKTITWITKNKEYATEYSDGEHILSYRVKIKNPFDFGYRTLQVYVKLSDIISRIMVRLNELHGSGLSKSQAKKVYDELDKFEEKNTSKLNQMKKVWEFWSEYPELIKILKMMKFDSIVANEGLNDDIQTYGVFNQNQLKLIKP